MSIKAALNHITHYKYERPVKLGPQVIRLRPAPHTKSHICSYSLNIHPSKHFINWQQDPFGNYMARIVFPDETKEFRVEVDLITEIRVFNPLDFFLEESAEHYPLSYDNELKAELAPYLEIKENGSLLNEFIKKINSSKQNTIDFIFSCNSLVNRNLEYLIRLEPGVQSCEETLSTKKGSCRDMAWLLCQLLRHCGLASRFVSGYLIQLKQDVKSLDGPSGCSEDFTDLHAWTEVYLPGAGWVGLDATSGLFAGEGHIPLSCSPNPSSAAPISGSHTPSKSTMNHLMKVARVYEKPRVTKPYTEDQWLAIDKLGEKVDEDLVKRDIRLTMGGEPTFVSIDDFEGDEWNFKALSPQKFLLGDNLATQLSNRWSSKGLIQYCQGKWYPGEELPRWAISYYFRKDNDPIWNQQDLLARACDNFDYSQSKAKEFITTLSQCLGIDSSFILEAYEDSQYYLWKEQRLPIDNETAKSDLPKEKPLDKTFDVPVGYVLPLHYSRKRVEWISNRWQFKSGQLILTPGDSPIGLRLPLASLPEATSDEINLEQSPFEQVTPLPKRNELENRVKNYCQDNSKSYEKDPNGFIHTALCAEVKEGKLHLFLPPITHIENFLCLIIAIESVAAETNTSVILEGYAPPSDLRIQQLSITPDPGVLEVNMPPAESWKELTKLSQDLYEEAYKARLSAQKFRVDGRQIGTGGGNHIVVGGSHPENSPFLRRPDLLRSLVTFWQNHPSLSYIFSSEYIGPTCQAPRIDEARHDSLYELDIAFQQISPEEKVPFWLTDRLFRNILVDLTGNTHRAEFCIDKLYSPESSRGRMGLLELRGFEMTPHYRMNLLQALLVRAIISSFWNTPYNQPLISWGTQLHDKYMLPQYLWEDFQDVLFVLKQHGYSFDLNWFKPFMDFRFPVFGTISVESVNLELRHALEPWPVLGEELFSGSTSRTVDSSVERLQVKVTGNAKEWYQLTCNGYPLTLQPTREKGVYVGGVRYKAWNPPSSLHPNIPIQSPLVFDLFDLVHKRSLGGCKYHVAHQGGRNYDKIPVVANEAEGRVLSRFEEMGHSPQSQKIKQANPHPDFPYTLDLRRCFSVYTEVNST